MRARFHRDAQEPRGPEAARLRQQRAVLRRRHALADAVEEMLPGSLSLSHFRCGKPTCHCVHDEGHPAWSLTYMREGRKRVLHIPMAVVDDIRARVEAGRRFQEAVREVLAANVELLVLARRRPTRPRTPP
jgi:hypothetical protein